MELLSVSLVRNPKEEATTGRNRNTDNDVNWKLFTFVPFGNRPRCKENANKWAFPERWWKTGNRGIRLKVGAETVKQK